METKNKDSKVEKYRRKFGYNKAEYFSPCGLSGGLARWWKDEVVLDIISMNKNVIDTKISVPALSRFLLNALGFMALQFLLRKLKSGSRLLI